MRSLPLRQPKLVLTAAGRFFLAVLLAAVLLLAMAACRTRTSWRVEYHPGGEVAAMQYSADFGFAPWSEGDGKVIDILDVTISGASLK